MNGLKAAIAFVFIVYPKAIDAWVGPTATSPGGRVLLRAFGIRDLSLALEAITAPDSRARRRWLAAGGVCDLVDAAATVVGSRRANHELGRLARLTSAWAGASGIACLALAATESDSAQQGAGLAP